MKLQEHLDALPELQRERLVGRLEGMQLAMRICRNRGQDYQEIYGIKDGELPAGYHPRALEAENCRAAIRFVQVAIGNGTVPFGQLSAAEQDDIDRIY